MADKPKNNLPKVPPFVIPGASDQRAEDPAPQNAHVVRPPQPSGNKDDFVSQRAIVSLTISLISLVSLGISMLSGAWFAYGILQADKESPAQEKTSQVATVTPTATSDPQTPTPTAMPTVENADSKTSDEKETGNSLGEILSSVIVIGLVFVVGWVSGVFGIRALGNLILPFAIRGYAILTLGGILYLQFRIIEKLFLQKYEPVNFVKYLTLFGAGILALALLHLMLEKHSLFFFGLLILLTSLAHLYLIAFHYIFVPEVQHGKLWGDIIFFLVTTITSALMMAHFGLLNGIRRFLAQSFSPKDNMFVPPN